MGSGEPISGAVDGPAGAQGGGVAADGRSPRRLYLDNAATSFPKPPAVLDAMVHYFRELGASPGRGAYAESVEAGRLMAECRSALCRLFNGSSSDHVIFTLNCTDALNLAIRGVLDPLRPLPAGEKPHAICTDLDHNSILRPLHGLLDRGAIELTRVPVDGTTGLVDVDDIRRAVRRNTRLIAVTHASNVSGTVQPIRDIGRVAREAAVPFLVDAAQSAGHVPIDVQADCIDLLAAPGHKFLMGPLGTGFLYLRPGLEKLLRPYREGGTGSVSEHDRQPEFLPDKYEAGSHNAPGIIGLLAGVRWVLQQGVENLYRHDQELVRTFLEAMLRCEGLTYYGPQGVAHRIGVFSVRVDGYTPHELSAVLEAEFGLLTRSGLHCAPHAHRTLGTADGGGTTRLSFGPFLSRQDVKFAGDVLANVAMAVARK
ncbi:MAG: aminotransferase class V-fold PLP-dependent enzyme [Tepidisphaerales bacterium]